MSTSALNVFAWRSHAAQSRRPDLLAHLEQKLGVEAETSARLEHPPERREIDRVLSLVVGGAAAVPAAIADRHLPRRASLAPLIVVARHHVAVAIDEHGRQRRALETFREEHRRRVGDRVFPTRPPKTQPFDRGADLVGQVP